MVDTEKKSLTWLLRETIVLELYRLNGSDNLVIVLHIMDDNCVEFLFFNLNVTFRFFLMFETLIISILSDNPFKHTLPFLPYRNCGPFLHTLCAKSCYMCPFLQNENMCIPSMEFQEFPFTAQLLNIHTFELNIQKYLTKLMRI